MSEDTTTAATMTMIECKCQRREKLKQKHLKALFQQQKLFTKPNLEAKAATLASISVCNIMAKRRKPYIDGEMVKEAILAAVENICPDKVSQFQSISLSRRTNTTHRTDLRRLTCTTNERAYKSKLFFTSA